MTPPRWIAGADPRRTLLRALAIALAGYITFSHLLMPVRGVGPSMDPTIASGELLFVSRITYRVREPRRGDIVAVRVAGGSVVFVKRVVALPGEELRIDKGIVTIDGEPLDEPYVRNRSIWTLPARRLGADEYFVVGDNRGMPMALHEMGIVSRTRFVGTVVF